MWYEADKRSIGLHGTLFPANRIKGAICFINAFASGPVGLLETISDLSLHSGWLTISTTAAEDSMFTRALVAANEACRYTKFATYINNT